MLAWRGRCRLGYWAMKVTDIFLTAQSYSSLGTSYVLIGHEHVVRISPFIDRGQFPLDSVKEIPSIPLFALGSDEPPARIPYVPNSVIEFPTLLSMEAVEKKAERLRVPNFIFPQGCKFRKF